MSWRERAAAWRWPGIAFFRLRLFFRGVFLLLALATIAIALSVLQDEKELSHRSYRQGFAKTMGQVAAQLRHPAGQLALLNPPGPAASAASAAARRARWISRPVASPPACMIRGTEWAPSIPSSQGESGPAARSRATPRATSSSMAAAESRGSDSRNTFLSGIDGSSFSTAARCARPVTTAMRSGTESGSRRSHVSRRSEWPDPVRSWRNLGASARESGHSRLPMPPAGMTA